MGPTSTSPSLWAIHIAMEVLGVSIMTEKARNLHIYAVICLVCPQETLRLKDTELLVFYVDGPFLTVFLDHATSVAAAFADTVGAPIRGEK